MSARDQSMMSDAERTHPKVANASGRNEQAWVPRALEGLTQDVWFGVRTLRKSLAFSAAAVVTIALGIGANTAIFSVVYAVLLKPLPYSDSEQLFNVFQTNPQQGVAGTGWSYPNFVDLRSQNHVFSGLAGSQRHQLTLTGLTEPSVVDVSVVTPELFAVFGESALIGRGLVADDGEPGKPPVAVLSEGLWRGSFRSDPEIIGTGISLDNRPFTIVGVMRSAFRFPSLTKAAQLWIPLAQDPLFGGWMERRGGHWLQVTARLGAGVSVAQAQAELDTINARLASEFPAENRGWQIRMVPLREMIVQDVRGPMLLLLGAACLVLLIACANVSNLLLTRATMRAPEIAVRTALGASRSRIVQQLLSESMVLGALGGLLGIVLAYWGVEGLIAMLPTTVPQVNAIQVDGVVLAFALALTMAASTVFGLAPAWFASNSSVSKLLREGGPRGGQSGGRQRARMAFAAAEISLAIVLLLAAGLLLRSFAKLQSVDPGFEAHNVVMADISLPRFQYSKPQQWSHFSSELLRRLHARPGMGQTAVVIPRPIVDGNINIPFTVVGEPRGPDTAMMANYVSISPEYFSVMDIPLIAGRSFSEFDATPSVPVAVISQALARQYFPNQDAIGKQIVFGFPSEPPVAREIVGIVGDVRDMAIARDPGPMMYVPFAQAPFWGANLVVKSTLGPAAVAAILREEVGALDKGLPVTDVRFLAEPLDMSLGQVRFRTLLLGVFASIALLLAATGVFGVISYSVSLRTNEIGIRTALGASQTAIMTMISRDTAMLTLAGLVVGIPCALVSARLIQHMLFGVSVLDTFTVAAVVAAIIGVSSVATYLPTRRALRVGPMEALRHD